MKISAGAGDITGHPPHLLISYPPFHSHNHRQTTSQGFCPLRFFFLSGLPSTSLHLTRRQLKGDKANSLKSLAMMYPLEDK